MNSSTPLQTSPTALIEKIVQLPPDKITEVEDFVDFLLSRAQNHSLVTAAANLSEAAFQSVWDNSSDAEYDRL
jgi:Protein of unknown function (DUF2281)